MIRNRAAAVALMVLLAAFAVAMWTGSRGVSLLASSIVGACAVLLAMHDTDSRRDDR